MYMTIRDFFKATAFPFALAVLSVATVAVSNDASLNAPTGLFNFKSMGARPAGTGAYRVLSSGRTSETPRAVETDVATDRVSTLGKAPAWDDLSRDVTDVTVGDGIEGVESLEGVGFWEERPGTPQA